MHSSSLQTLNVHNGSICVRLFYFFGGLTLLPGLVLVGLSFCLSQLVCYIICGILWGVSLSYISDTGCFQAFWSITKNRLWFNTGIKILIMPFIWIFIAFYRPRVVEEVIADEVEKLIEEEEEEVEEVEVRLTVKS